MNKLKALTLTSLLTISAPFAHGLILSTSIGASDSLVITIEEEISLTTTGTSSTTLGFVVQNAFSTPHTTFVSGSAYNSTDITVTSSAGGTATAPNTSGIAANGDTTNSDIFVLFNAGALSTDAGASITFSVGSYTLDPSTAYTILPDNLSNATFALIDGWGNIVSDSISVAPSAVPEPSTYALMLGLGALGVIAFRRHRMHKRSSTEH